MKRRFGCFFETYSRRLFHLAYYYLDSRELAEEAVLDVFTVVWQKRETLAAAEAKVFLRQYAGMLRHVQDFDRKKRTVSIGSCAPVPISVLVQRITVACPDTSISTEF